MSKQTFLIISEKGAWIGSGQDGSRPAISSLERIEFESGSGGKQWAESVSKHFTEKRLSKKGVMAVFGSCVTELRPIAVPPVDKKSLPPIVHIQAKSQLVSVSEKSDIDYCPTIGFQHGTPGDVVASTFNLPISDFLQQLKSEGFSFRNQVPQLLALENLKADSQNTCTLWVNIFENQIEFSLLGKNQLGVVRFAVIPASGDGRSRAITREVVRTLSVIASQPFGNIKFSGLVHSGNTADCDTAVATLDENGIQAKAVGLTDFGTDSSDGNSDPAIKLVAMGLLASGKESLIDYVNPTKPPKEKADVRQYVTAALIAAVLLCGIGFWAWTNIKSVQDKTASIEKQIKLKVADEKTNQFLVNSEKELFKHIEKDPNWLDEIEYLSKKLPHGENLQLSSISIGKSYLSMRQREAADFTQVGLATSMVNNAILEKVSNLFTDDKIRKKEIVDEASKSKKNGLEKKYSVAYNRSNSQNTTVLGFLEHYDRMDDAEGEKESQVSEVNAESDTDQKNAEEET